MYSSRLIWYSGTAAYFAIVKKVRKLFAIERTPSNKFLKSGAKVAHQQCKMANVNPLVDKAKVKLDKLLASSVDGPERLVAEAILKGPEQVRYNALNGGLASNQLRQIAWPFLLSDRVFTDDDHSRVRDHVAEVETFRQIELDVPRSVDAADRQIFEEFLKEFFRKHRDLCFYQGFADVAYAVYRIMSDGVIREEGEAGAHFVLGRLSRQFFIREAHRPTFDAIYAYLPAIKAIVSRFDKELSKLWDETDANNFWAISPLVCLFSHDLELPFVAKILDSIIASEKVFEFPVYLVASLVMLPSVRSKLLENEHDACVIHETMLDACKNDDNADSVIEAAIALQAKVPAKLVLKVATNAGLPTDSQFVVNSTHAGTTFSKKRSWRTLNFFSQSLEIGIF